LGVHNSKKPGGTFVITNEKYIYRIIQAIKDEAGRWVGNVYAYKSKTTLALVSMYKVGNNRLNAACQTTHNKLLGCNKIIGTRIQYRLTNKT
jgi:hypothetical protein